MFKLKGLLELNGFKGLFSLALALIGTVAYADVYVDGQLIDGNDITSISILQPSGRINISTTGYTVTKNSTSPTALVVSFTSSASTIEKGQSVTLSWTTQNASSCTATGSWTGALSIPNGTSTITLNTAGSYTFTINCDGTSGDSLSRTQNVIVTEPVVVPTTCATPSMPGNVLPWATVFRQTFPLPVSGDSIFDVTRSGYTAVQFDTGDFNGVGGLRLLETTTSTHIKFGAISECPGDFNVNPKCDHVWGSGRGITWGTIINSDICQLKKNTTYFFNLKWASGPAPQVSSCTSRKCVMRVQSTVREL